MKPTTLCFVKMGVKGLELVSSYPDVIPTEIMSQLVYKSMPMGAKHGDFASTTLDNLNLSSYVFRIPRTEQRDNIASIVAVFSSTDYDQNTIRRAFSWVITELSNKELLSTETLTKILPNLYKGFGEGKFKIEISTSSTITFNFHDEKPKKKRRWLWSRPKVEKADHPELCYRVQLMKQRSR